jgi:large subunit ribosomal protein L30
MATIKVTWLRSGINQKEDQKRTLRALGLRKLGQTVEHDDNRTIRGMVMKVRHLVEVQDGAGGGA